MLLDALPEQLALVLAWLVEGEPSCRCCGESERETLLKALLIGLAGLGGESA